MLKEEKAIDFWVLQLEEQVLGLTPANQLLTNSDNKLLQTLQTCQVVNKSISITLAPIQQLQFKDFKTIRSKLKSMKMPLQEEILTKAINYSINKSSNSNSRILWPTTTTKVLSRLPTCSSNLRLSKWATQTTTKQPLKTTR